MSDQGSRKLFLSMARGDLDRALRAVEAADCTLIVALICDAQHALTVMIDALADEAAL